MAKKKLSIVVPYRDRKAHLDKFILHILKYFKHDKADHEIPVAVTVVEPEAGGLFNAAMLRNIGFDLTREFDYHVFHDVDYLPIWADYSYSDQPARLIWYGADVRPVAPGAKIYNYHHQKKFRGGVIMVPKEVFLNANGYSNEFWGWGYQDSDMAHRCMVEGYEFELRDGYYQALDHVSRGYDAAGERRPRGDLNVAKGRANAMVMEAERAYKTDGLTTLKYEVLKTTPWNVADDMRPPNFLFGQHVKVRLPGQEDTPDEDVVIEAKEKAKKADA